MSSMDLSSQDLSEQLLPIVVPPHSGVGYKMVFPHHTVAFPDEVEVVVHKPTREPFGEQIKMFWKNVSSLQWETSTFTAFKHCIKEDQTTVLDFGSWIGPTVLYSAALGARQVLSFEPDPAAFAELQVNVGLNGFSNVRLHQACIGPVNGLQTLYFRDGSSVSTTAKETSHDYFQVTGEFHVYCHTVDKVLKKYLASSATTTAPLFIKIDTEGFEVDLLPSLVEVFKKYQPAVHLSVHPMLREFGEAEWKAVYEAVRVFPKRFLPAVSDNGQGIWKQVKMKGWKECQALLTESTEIMLMWSKGQCAGIDEPELREHGEVGDDGEDD